MWFHYSQNNTGGNFSYDAKNGITHHVVIEAASTKEADKRAESIGLYWDGCVKDMDCPCCGDRWSPAYGEGDTQPSVYGEPVEKPKLLSHWMGKGKFEIFVHPLNGDFYGASPGE